MCSGAAFSCSHNGWVCCLGVQSISFAGFLSLPNIDPESLAKTNVFVPPLVHRIVQRVRPELTELYSALLRREIVGDVRYPDCVARRETLCTSQDDPVISVSRGCDLLDNGAISWTPEHKLWTITFRTRFVSTDISDPVSKKQRWISVQTECDLCFIPFHVTFQSYSLSLDTSSCPPFHKYLDHVLQSKTDDFSEASFRVVALLSPVKEPGLARRVAAHYAREHRHFVALVDLLSVASVGPHDPSFPLLARFMELLEGCRYLPSFVLLVDRPETWCSEASTDDVLQEISRMLKSFGHPRARCILVLQSETLPVAFDGLVDVVVTCPFDEAQPRILKPYDATENQPLSLLAGNIQEDLLENSHLLKYQVDQWFQSTTISSAFFDSPVLSENVLLDSASTSCLKHQLYNAHITPYMLKHYDAYRSRLPVEVREGVEGFLKDVCACKSRATLPRLLIHGPAGSGKSSLCVMLHIVHQITVIPIILSQLISAAFGMSQRYLESAFQLAYDARPALVVFEDIEALVGPNIDDNQWGQEIGDFLCSLVDRPAPSAVYVGGPTIGILLTSRFRDPHTQLPKLISSRFCHNAIQLPPCHEAAGST